MAVDVVTELYRRFAENEDPFPLLDEQIAWDVEMLEAPAGYFKGHRGVAEFFRRWLGTWDDYRLELEDVRALPDGRFLATFRERACGRGSRVPVEMRTAAILELRDGKVITYRGYTSREHALSDAGLS